MYGSIYDTPQLKFVPILQLIQSNFHELPIKIEMKIVIKMSTTIQCM